MRAFFSIKLKLVKQMNFIVHREDVFLTHGFAIMVKQLFFFSFKLS